MRGRALLVAPHRFARLLMSPLLSIGLVLVLMLTGSTTTAASWTGGDPAGLDAPSGAPVSASVGETPCRRHVGSHLRPVDAEPTSTLELASAESESDDTFEATATTHPPVLVPYSTTVEVPPHAPGSDTGRRLVLTGLGRGPPR